MTSRFTTNGNLGLTSEQYEEVNQKFKELMSVEKSAKNYLWAFFSGVFGIPSNTKRNYTSEIDEMYKELLRRNKDVSLKSIGASRSTTRSRNVSKQTYPSPSPSRMFSSRTPKTQTRRRSTRRPQQKSRGNFPQSKKRALPSAKKPKSAIQELSPSRTRGSTRGSTRGKSNRTSVLGFEVVEHPKVLHAGKLHETVL